MTKAVASAPWAASRIVDGPVVNSLGKAGFLFPGLGAGSGATVDGFTFEVAFPVFSRGADDISITRNTMHGANQGVTNWANGTWGKGWDITHNTLLDLRTSCAGASAASSSATTRAAPSAATSSPTTTSAAACASRGTTAAATTPRGIVLFADWRYPGDTGATITGNRVTKNRVSLSSTRPALVPVAGVELSDTRNLAAELDITDNAVVYNDLRGLAVPVALTPEELSTVNRIEKNLTGPGHSALSGRALDALAPGAGAASPTR